MLLLNNLNLTCRFIKESEATTLILSEAIPTAPRCALEIERIAAANDVANIPALTNDCNAIDIAGVESVQSRGSSREDM